VGGKKKKETLFGRAAESQIESVTERWQEKRVMMKALGIKSTGGQMLPFTGVPAEGVVQACLINRAHDKQ